MEKHAGYLKDAGGAAEHYRLMPANRLFALGVGHIRRRDIPIWEQGGRAGRSDRHEHRPAERIGLAGAGRR